MVYVITQPCIDVKNKACVDVCPVSCIYLETDDVDRKVHRLWRVRAGVPG